MADSRHLKLHPLTGTTDHDLTGLVAGEILSINSAGDSVSSTGLETDGSGGLSATTFDGGVITSGGTNLYDIFLTDVSDATTVTEGANIDIVNVGDDYTIAVVDSPSFNDVAFSGTATGGDISVTNATVTGDFSGGTSGALYSGGTDLYDIFVTGLPTGANLWTDSTGTNSIRANNGTTEAAGDYAVAMGSNTKATGNYSLASGYINTATTDYSTTIGGQGNQANATGYGSNVFGGRYNTASGDYQSTIVGGRYSTASGSISTILGGGNNTASGYYYNSLRAQSLQTYIGKPINYTTLRILPKHITKYERQFIIIEVLLIRPLDFRFIYIFASLALIICFFSAESMF